METRRTHGVVVATGAHHAIQEHMNDDSGSFMIMPSLKGQEAIDFSQEGFMPFCVGDVNPDGMFVHVFDDVGVRRVLEHLNTITDFTRYLNKRAEYLRSGKLFLCHGEEELLANYLNVVIRTGGDYDFELPRKKGDENSGLVTLQGQWSAYVLSEGYFAKTLADDISYTWDRLAHLPGKVTPHTLRHTAATCLMQRGVPIWEAAGFLGMSPEVLQDIGLERGIVLIQGHCLDSRTTTTPVGAGACGFRLVRFSSLQLARLTISPA
jgi:hypothetical protein